MNISREEYEEVSRKPRRDDMRDELMKAPEFYKRYKESMDDYEVFLLFREMEMNNRLFD